MKKLLFCIVSLLMSGILVACDDDAPLPNPLALTHEAIGAYCGMILTEHPGPKAQVFEKNNPEPHWFTSVKDAVMYLTLPGEAQDAIVTYVQDMAVAHSWERPQDDGIWINLKDAYFVVGSRKIGGMGMPEFVPFSIKEKAIDFSKQYGGRVVRLSEITTEDLDLAHTQIDMGKIAKE
ncbi:copper resistance protein CopZ [Sneathiella sp. P13V-1]|uniref:nitrous oxide reductase accessory protein NosL n=1 Tax=Sneathiella sp. P13V-1 TaxID=2697366 RepID=UPI00187B23A8|nr:nitrous oxide reductase accessory protein NosL [Sneathiella sp. P13V-1]MBE7635919.1 copper resistance protein CopZ [Sneathiella sp. P13V-1]